MGVGIIGLGKYLPKKVVTNDDISHLVDTDRTWIIERTGIEQRHIATTETGTDMACRAAEEALGDIDRNSIGLVLVATVTPDDMVPVTSAQVKRRLGLEHAVAFDVNAACSGFMYGMWTAEAIIKNGMVPGAATMEVKRALVIGVERLSRITNWEERSSCILFGDGAGAAVLEYSPEEPGILSTYLKNYDDHKGVLTCGKGYKAIPFWEDKEAYQHLSLRGKAVFKFAVNSIEEVTLAALEKAGLSLNDVDWFVPHQANLRIMDAAARRLNQPLEKFQISINKSANVSSASIPMALYDLQKTGKIRKGDKVAVMGFGGGLCAAAAIIQW
ncbi:MAG: ketoacyl-ACP synthase III [Firmicutes bacterium]|nr:ketoacyl-ACP synthase III [Bacillota bacterium]